MKEIKNSKILAINISSQFATLVFGKIFGAIASLALIRYLGAEKQGIYSYILSVVYIFGFFADFGINKYLTREARINKEKGREIFGNALIIQIFQILSAILLINIYALVFDINAALRNELFVASIVLNLGYASHPFTAVLNSYEKMYLSGIANAAISILNAIAIVTAIYLKFSIINIFIVLGVVNMVNVFISSFLCFKYTVTPKFNIKWEAMKSIIVGCVPFVMIGLFSNFHSKIDVLILYKFKPPVEVGYYTATTKVMDILNTLISMIVLPLYPRLSYIINAKSKDEAMRVMKLSIKYIMAVVAPFALMVTMFNYDFTVLLFGEEFLQSRYAFAIIIWVIFVISIHAIPVHAINAARHSKLIIIIFSAASAVNIILNILFIPKYSFIATSYIVVFSNVIILLLSVIIVNKKIGKLNIFPYLMRLAVGLFPVFVFWHYTYGKANYIVLSITGLLLYAVWMVVIRYIDEYDINMFKGIFSKAK